jgi:hypothetical protein
MTKKIYILLILVFGFSLAPNIIFSCGTESEKIETSCDKQSDSEIEKNDCCGKENGLCGKHGKDCDGNCGNPDCHCPTNCTSFTIPFFAPLSQAKIILRKPKYYYQEAYYSSGFLSIWLPPKIG